MPRRPPAHRTGPIQRRTRTGCQTCRSRKIKCDEEQPNCRKCVSRGLKCERNVPLKWETDYSARGLAFGRQGVFTKSKDSQSPPPNPGLVVHRPDILLEVPQVRHGHFINLFLSDFNIDPFGVQTCVEEGPDSTQAAEIQPTDLASTAALSYPI